MFKFEASWLMPSSPTSAHYIAFVLPPIISSVIIITIDIIPIICIIIREMAFKWKKRKNAENCFFFSYIHAFTNKGCFFFGSWFLGIKFSIKNWIPVMCQWKKKKRNYIMNLIVHNDEANIFQLVQPYRCLSRINFKFLIFFWRA